MSVTSLFNHGCIYFDLKCSYKLPHVKHCASGNKNQSLTIISISLLLSWSYYTMIYDHDSRKNMEALVKLLSLFSIIALNMMKLSYLLESTYSKIFFIQKI